MKPLASYTITLVIFISFIELISIASVKVNNKSFTPLISRPQIINHQISNIATKEVTIGRAKLTFLPQEGYDNKFKNSEIAMSKLEDIQVIPGSIFSFNTSSDLLSPKVNSIYYPGYDLAEDLVPAGGICSVAVLLASAVNNASLQFVDLNGNNVSKPVPHGDFFPLYHRTLEVDGYSIKNIDATVATGVDKFNKSYSLNDMKFLNTSGKTIIMHFTWDWTNSMSSTNTPFIRNKIPTSMIVRLNTLE